MLLNCGVGEDSWESLGLQEIQPVHPKGDQSWVFFGGTDVEAETPILWLPDAKNWLNGKDPDAGKDWRQEEKGTTEDEMVGWHHRLNGHGFGWTPGIGDEQGGLACCGSWGHKESDTTERLNWTELNQAALALWNGEEFLLRNHTLKLECCSLFSLTPRGIQQKMDPELTAFRDFYKRWLCALQRPGWSGKEALVSSFCWLRV